MSDSIDLFEPEGFIVRDLRRPHVTIRPRKARRINRKAIAIYRNSDERVATESVEDTVVIESRRLDNNVDPSHRLSMRLDDRKGPSPVSTRLREGLPRDNKSFPSLRETNNPRNLRKEHKH